MDGAGHNELTKVTIILDIRSELSRGTQGYIACYLERFGHSVEGPNSPTGSRDWPHLALPAENATGELNRAARLRGSHRQRSGVDHSRSRVGIHLRARAIEKAKAGSVHRESTRPGDRSAERLQNLRGRRTSESETVAVGVDRRLNEKASVAVVRKALIQLKPDGGEGHAYGSAGGRSGRRARNAGAQPDRIPLEKIAARLDGDRVEDRPGGQIIRVRQLRGPNGENEIVPHGRDDIPHPVRGCAPFVVPAAAIPGSRCRHMQHNVIPVAAAVGDEEGCAAHNE